jgi:hypothetical protein
MPAVPAKWEKPFVLNIRKFSHPFQWCTGRGEAWVVQPPQLFFFSGIVLYILNNIPWLTVKISAYPL